MTTRTIAELLTTTAKLEELPLGAVRDLLALRPQARELADRLDALEKNVGGLLAAKSATVEPAPAPVEAVAPSARKATAVGLRTEAWTLQGDDIKPGIIAWFNDDTLNTDPHVSKPDQFDNRVSARAKGGRPFVCIEADDEESTWVSLSLQYRPTYLKLQPEWIWPRGALNGSSHFTGHVYEGPHESFCVAAAQTEFQGAKFRRPRLNAKGLEAVLAFTNQDQD